MLASLRKLAPRLLPLPTGGGGFTEQVLDVGSARVVGINLIWATVLETVATQKASSGFLGTHPGLRQPQES